MNAFDEQAWRENCYLPYNNIFASFLTLAPDMPAMCKDQQERSGERQRVLREECPGYDPESWGKYVAWVNDAELALLDQIEFSLANGDLWAPDTLNAMAIGHRICRMQIPPMEDWKPLSVKVLRSPYHGGGHIVDIVPADESIDVGVDFSKPDPGEKRGAWRMLPPANKGRT